VDERTDIDQLLKLVADAGAAARFIEWGVLYSPAQAGKGGRYPSLEWLESFAAKANEADLNIALHLCGKSVKDLLDSVRTRERSAEVKRLFALAEKFGRVQLNTRGKEDDAPVFSQLIGQLHRSENRTGVIVQWNEHNAPLCRRLQHEYGFETLVDGSGGRGIVPDAWPVISALDARRIGYAGGLGPATIGQQLPAIYRAAQERAFWIDMEQALRDEHDNFVLDRCRQVLTAVAAYDQVVQLDLGRIHGAGMQPVAKLSGLWLDYWVGRSRNYPMVVPPQDACKAVYLHRASGRFESYEPSEGGAGEVLELMQEERIGIIPCGKERWRAVLDPDTDEVTGPTPQVALLRAVVAREFGKEVPRNPAEL
jgi:hypothetical protein